MNVRLPEAENLGVGAGLVPIQPGHVVVAPALLLHLAPLARLLTDRPTLHAKETTKTQHKEPVILDFFFTAREKVRS